ncbi:MAG TPA: 3-deoxy-manno-octulosonate cytidylyltransferase [Thermoanaerobaculia bacterium]|nr:3-deoxy-manno-octulosonate cytidylyltransferase [Thermoanaerobaculia bacterium]
MHPSHPPPASPPPPSPVRRIVGAIPARYGSTRLPGKPLLRLHGRPMIEHVYRRTAEARGLDRVVVLTDDQRIGEAVTAFGGEWEMTPAECASGTDRIAHAARGWDDVDAVINVQGDWLIAPDHITRLAHHLREHPGDPVATLAVPASRGDLETPSAVKVVCDRRGYALYFSRAAIPYPRADGGDGAARHLKHWGIYGYRRETLLELAAAAPTPLEQAESLEQLRALENGIPIHVLVVQGQAASLDTPEDVAGVEAALAGNPLTGAAPGGNR